MTGNPSVKSALLMVPLVVAVFSAAYGLQRYGVRSTKPDNASAPLNDISQYKTWTLVNPTPVKMEFAVAQLCAAIGPQNPHRNKFISVYVNEIGKQAMTMQLTPRFPEGSVIVKEKLDSEGSQSPELLTAMVKREKGYNPKSGDWEYLVLDGTASKVTKRGKLMECSRCHVAYQSTDYVTRTYLSDEARRQLK